jgi:broad specificity phosphatase PhoE
VTTELYLIRHGETDWNLQHRIQGLTDIPLNETGRDQARAAGRLLAGRGFDGIYASPLSRARETAEIIAAEVGLAAPGVVDALVERNYGDAEGLSFAEVDRRYPDRSLVPGEETREAVAERVLPALHELAVAHPDEALIIVSHGGAIRSVLMSVQPEESYGRIGNGSVHSFRFDAGELSLIAFDDPLEPESIDEQNALESREGGAA